MLKLIKKFVSIIVICVMLFSFNACTQPENPTDEAMPVQATVIEVEKYGHAVLDVTTAEFFALGYALGDVVCVRFDSYEFEMPFYNGYYTNPGDVLLRGLAPEKNIAVCINYGDFSKETGLNIGDTVEISMAEKAGMLAYQELCSLTYSNDRADYPDDATFANFRAVTIGEIGNGKLFRSASPINNEHGRASYANTFIEAAGVATVLNLADSDEDIAEYIASEDFASEYYAYLYDSGKVMALDLAGDFFSDNFATALVGGIRFLSQSQPPYSVHCTEGKDRAGFTVMLLGGLMGAELEEIIDDYMLSFYNYYGITKENQPDRYNAVLNNNLMPILYHVTGAENEAELKTMDLESAITDFLLEYDMTENEILTLKTNLR